MTARKLELVELLHHGVDPFAFIKPSQCDVDFHGWNSHHIFLTEIIEELQPRTIVEVGVWKGGSVMRMASKLQALSLDAAIIAVDTFRGSSEHWCNPELFKMMNVRDGIPSIYDTFVANLFAKSLQQYVVPMPVDSHTASEILREKNTKVDIVHIDAGHSYRSVKNDLEDWSALVSKDGAIIMDDYLWDDEIKKATAWPGVAKAVNEFVKLKGDNVRFRNQDAKCIINFK